MPFIWATSTSTPPWQGWARSRLPCGFGEHWWDEIEQTGGAQLVDPRQVVQAVQVEMDEKFSGCHPQKRAPRTGAPSLRPHPTGFHQRVDRSFGDNDAPDLLDLGARHRLVVGDHGKCLDRRAGKLTNNRPFDA